MKPIFSICMMVKNEQELLPQCLESIKQILDEEDQLVIIDTGSTDKTVEIAESFGAEIYHSPWTNNFSYHRNESVSKATGEWIFIIDADEKLVIHPEITKEKIKQWFSEVPKEVGTVAVQIQDIQNGELAMCCNSARIFRRGNIRYEGIVHNQPIFEGSCGICGFMALEHYGYGLSEEKMDKKFNRTRKLLMKEYHDNPKNLQVPFYLCQLYGQHGDISASVRWGDEYIKHKEEMGKDFNTSIYFTQIRNYQTMENFKKAYEILRMGLKDDPTNPDLSLALSDQGTFTKESHIVAEGARRYLKGYKTCIDKPDTMGGRFYFTLRPDALSLMIYRLCISCFQEGMDAWLLFQDNKKYADPEMMEEFKDNLKSLGMQHLIEKMEETLELPKLKLPLAMGDK